jgi:hypothetical protein
MVHSQQNYYKLSSFNFCFSLLFVFSFFALFALLIFFLNALLPHPFSSKKGLSVGLAFIVGAMGGGILTQKKGPRMVFKCAAAVAGVATLIAAVALPESLKLKLNLKLDQEQQQQQGAVAGDDIKEKMKKNEGGVGLGGPTTFSLGNPFSSLRFLFFRSRASAGTALAFLCFWAGLNGIQINLFNFAQHKFG